MWKETSAGHYMGNTYGICYVLEQCIIGYSYGQQKQTNKSINTANNLFWHTNNNMVYTMTTVSDHLLSYH